MSISFSIHSFFFFLNNENLALLTEANTNTNDITALKADVNNVKTDITNIKNINTTQDTDITNIKTDINIITSPLEKINNGT